MNRISFGIIALLLTCMNSAFGEPVISTTAGSVSANSTITVIGSSFGTRTSATPYYFDDFESYLVGTDALHAGLQDNGYDGQGLPYVRSDRSISGSKSMRMDYVAGKDSMFPRLGKQGFSTTEVYVSMWTYITHTTGTKPYPVFKLVRGGAMPTYSGRPGFYETVRHNAAGVVEGTDRGSGNSAGQTTWTQDILPGGGQDTGAWHRTEYYYKLSTPGVADGIWQQWVDGVQNVNLTNDMNRLAGNASTIQYMMAPFDGNDSYNDSANGIIDNSWQIWLDDFYIDTTRARVEIGDASSFTKCKVKFIQPSTSWNDTSITVNTELGTFSAGQTVYVYVVDANGVVNTLGYPILVGSSTAQLSPIRPMPPIPAIRTP